MADVIDRVVAVLTDDAWLAMPPAPHEYRGRSAIALTLSGAGITHITRFLDTRLPAIFGLGG